LQIDDPRLATQFVIDAAPVKARGQRMRNCGTLASKRHLNRVR
jgi:hypothetical protein